MHASELVELAAIASAQGRALVETATPLSSTSIEQYWSTSKCRLDRWSRALKSFASKDASGRRETSLRWRATRVVIEEILISEILTRVWTCVLCAFDRRHGAAEAEPIARSVLQGHLEARHRALGLIASSAAIDAEDAVGLNRLRRCSERWCDLFWDTYGLFLILRNSLSTQSAPKILPKILPSNKLNRAGATPGR